MEILPVDDDELYVDHLYLIVIGWIVVTILIAIIASIPTL